MNFDTIRGPGGLTSFEYTLLRVPIVKLLKKIDKTTKINRILSYLLFFCRLNHSNGKKEKK